MAGLWPELLLALLFLVGDILFTGVKAAAAGALAGFIAFTAARIAGKRKPILLVEGLALSAVTLAAELLSFPGGALALAGIVLGAFLFVTGLRGRPALAHVAGPMVGRLISDEEGAVLSVFAGGAFLVYGAATAALSASGRGGQVSGLVLLPAVMALAGVLSGRRLRKLRERSVPRLAEPEGSGLSTLSVRGLPAGRVKVTEEGSVAVVEVHELEAESLALLEKALARAGYRSLVVTAWPHDPVHLEIGGYSGGGGHWRKVLR